jgi:cobalt-zinc-cadmium efflux system protein
MGKLKESILKLPGISNVHHIHVWALSTQINALTAHIVVNDTLTINDEQKLKENIKHQLLHLNIQHATLETERSGAICKDEDCE